MRVDTNIMCLFITKTRDSTDNENNNNKINNEGLCEDHPVHTSKGETAKQMTRVCVFSVLAKTLNFRLEHRRMQKKKQ